MELILKFETRELKLVKEHSCYNYLCHEIKHPKMGITHLFEIYDDVSQFPSYELGIFEDDKFTELMSGEGEPIPDNCETTGGVWVEIEIFHPECALKLRNSVNKEGE